MSMINPLARARGLGSARQGVHHWYMQRATALLMILLVAWLIYAMASLAGSNYQAALSFLAQPFNAVCAVLLAITGLYHGMLGLQVVIEDYVHRPGVELALQLLVKALGYAGMVVGVVYILRIALA